jgi:hypothetical protein
MAKVVVAGRQASRCRICSSGRREVFDSALEDYYRGVPCRVTGEKLVWSRLAERASVLCGETVSVRAARRHAENHCLVTGASEAAELEAQSQAGDELLADVMEQIDGLLQSGEPIPPASLLQIQERLYLTGVRRKLERNEVPNLSHEVGAKAAERLMQVAKAGEQATLLACLTQGIEAAFKGQLGGGAAGELEPVVVEAEIVAEDDGEAS